MLDERLGPPGKSSTPRFRPLAFLAGPLDAAAVLALILVLPLVSVYASRGTPTVVAAAALLALMAALASGGVPAFRRRLARGLDERRLPHWSYLWAALIMWGALSAIWSIEPAHSFERAVTIALFSTIATGLYLLLLPFDCQRHGPAGAIGIAGASLLLIVEYSGNGILLQYLHDGDPHMLNRAMLTVSLLLWPVLALLEGPRRWLLGSGLVALVATAALLSESETAALALLVGLATAALAAWRPIMVAVAGVAGSAIAFFGMPFIVRALREWLSVEALGRIAVRTSADARLDIWDASAAAILHRPLLGWGLDVSRFFGLGDHHMEAAGFVWPIGAMHHPHNGMLQAWLEVGLAGPILLFGLTCGSLTAAMRLARPVRPWAFACIAAILSALAVSHGLWQSWWLSLLLLLVILFSLIGRE